ncbi:MAG: sulfatase [Rikenellaceae bacterium]
MKAKRLIDLGAKGALGACAALSLGSCSQPAETKPMNILFIMSDDHSVQTISAYDNRFISTPNIDRIAADGVKFTRSFVANSISGPSRACMLTGKHSHVNGYTDNDFAVFDGDQPTFPKMLQKVGYQTAVIGKWHLTSLPQGFDYWDILIGQGEYYQPQFIHMGDTITRSGYATTVTTDLALEWLDEDRDQDKPFCLLLHHKAPHRSWMPDVNDLDLFEGVEFPLPDNIHDNYEGRLAAAKQDMSLENTMDLKYDLKVNDPNVPSPYEYLTKSILNRMTAEEREIWDAHYQKRIDEYNTLKPEGKELIEWKYQQYMRDYLQVVYRLDQNIGRVLDYLEQKGLLENTLVVYTSDQGFYMGEHGWFDKRFMYEESFCTPLVMRLPNGKKGQIDQLVQNIDYAPTFLELANAPIPDDIQGESLVPLLKGEKPEDWRGSLYYHFYEYPGEHSVRRHYGVRTERYKLIRFYNDIEAWELYDLEEDPKEMNNLYGKPGTEEITSELKAELTKLREQYGSTEG